MISKSRTKLRAAIATTNKLNSIATVPFPEMKENEDPVKAAYAKLHKYVKKIPIDAENIINKKF